MQKLKVSFLGTQDTKKTVFYKKTVFFLTFLRQKFLRALLLGNIWGIRDRG